MPIKSKQLSAILAHNIFKPAYVSLAITGLLVSMPAQAFLPTPVAVIDTSNEADTKAGLPLVASKTDSFLANTVDFSTIQTQDLPSNTLNNTSAEQQLAAWRAQAQSSTLAQHTTWRRLLYFDDDKKSLLGKTANKSLVDNKAFFLSATGQQDSAAELDATLVALAEEVANNKNNHQAQINNNSVSCRFPARVQWLTDTLNIDKAQLQVSCPELDAWMAELAPNELSVMFAQEYLDNPLSAFAHTLLRIDSKKSAADFNQIHHAYALNDTVNGDKSDNFVLFAVKAFSGGYNNVIEIDPYDTKIAKYLKGDERDTWTYQLDLTPSEVQQVMAHVWETKDLAIPYYFTTDNCASEILRLMEVIRPQKQLLSQLPYAVVPSDVVNLLAKEGLLADTGRYTPSDSSVRQAQLNEARQAAKLGYQVVTKDDINTIKSAKLNLASSISADGKLFLPTAIAVSNNNPLDRHPLHRATIGIGHRGDNSYIDVGWRAGFHDNLDRPAGYAQFFNLEGLAATLRFYDDSGGNDANNPASIELQNLTLLSGRSFNPVNAGKKGKTWGFSLEAKQVDDGSQQEGSAHLVGSTTLEYGKSWVFGAPRTDNSGALTGEMPPQLCYTFATGAVQGGRGLNKGFRLGAGLNAGCLYQINNRLRAQAQLQLPYWYHGSSDQNDVQGSYWQPITTLGLQYDIDENQAVKFEASHDWQDRIDANDDIKLSYLRYF